MQEVKDFLRWLISEENNAYSYEIQKMFYTPYGHYSDLEFLIAMYLLNTTGKYETNAATVFTDSVRQYLFDNQLAHHPPNTSNLTLQINRHKLFEKFGKEVIGEFRY
jgi:hypothetical protein